MIFPLLEIIGKKKFIYNEKTKKKILSRKFGNSYCINSIVRSKFVGDGGLGSWGAQGRGHGAQGAAAGWGAGRLGLAAGGARQRAVRGRRRARRARSAQASVLGRAGERQLGAGWARRRACGTGSWALAGRAGRASGTAGRAGHAGSWAVGARAAGRSRPGRGLGAGRAAWAPGLALGSALGALGPFSIRFDSFFFLSHQMNTVHCEIKIFFEKKKNDY